MKDTAQILEHEEIEIILKTNELFINFSDMTEGEQKSWIKLMKEDLENTVDDIEIFHHKINRFNSKKHTQPEDLRKMLDSLGNDNGFVLTEAHRNLVNELVEYERDSRHISFYNNYRTRYVDRFGDGIRCSCIIARKGTDIVRYLEFLKDPIITINGPNATTLKTSLESKF